MIGMCHLGYWDYYKSVHMFLSSKIIYTILDTYTTKLPQYNIQDTIVSVVRDENLLSKISQD